MTIGGLLFDRDYLTCNYFIHFRQTSRVNEKNPQLAEDFRAAIVNEDVDVIENILDKGRINIFYKNALRL